MALGESAEWFVDGGPISPADGDNTYEQEVIFSRALCRGLGVTLLCEPAFVLHSATHVILFWLKIKQNSLA